MVRQLMAYSRQTFRTPFKPLALKALVEDVASICRRTFDRKISLGVYASDDLPNASGDSAQLNQVFMNLLLNARDTLEEANNNSPFIRLDIDAVKLIVSGHAVSEEHFSGKADVLSKPLSMIALAHKVRAILDR